MGAWGPGIYSDDLACDVRDDFKNLLAEGMSQAAATEKILEEWSGVLLDPGVEPVFWLALADTQWRLGRLEERVRAAALHVIETGTDLARWEDAGMRQKRKRLLGRLRDQLRAPQPTPRAIPKRVRNTTDWSLGEIIAYRLPSHRQVLFHVNGYHEDAGGKYAIVEVLDWVGDDLPSASEFGSLPARSGIAHSANLMIAPPKQMPRQRIQRTGAISIVTRKPSTFMGVAWKNLDKLLAELFGLS